MVALVKSWVKGAIARSGYQLKRIDEIEPVDLRNRGNNPCGLFYYNRLQPAVIQAPVSKGIGLHFFSLSPSSAHPYIKALLGAHGSCDEKGRIASILGAYYQTVEPANAADWLGLDAQEAPELAAFPFPAVVFPWEYHHPRESLEGRRSRVRVENEEAGRVITLDEGWEFGGPVTRRKLLIETGRLYEIYDAIRREGFWRDNSREGDIGAVILRLPDGRWRWQVKGGQHRAAAASALGLRSIPVRVHRVVNRADVDLWPNVASGVYSRRTALKVFDSVFEGLLPPVVHPWMEVGTKGACRTPPRTVSTDG